MSKVVRIVIFIIFFISIILGMGLAGITIEAGLESDFYFGFSYQADESLKDLVCPIILTGDEIGTVSVTLSNPNEKEIVPLLQVDIGNRGMFRTYRDRMNIPAGESQTMRWTVSKDDVVFNHLILIKIFQFAAFKTPSRDGSCGIFYLDIPISGRAVMIFTIAASVLGMALSIFLWRALNKSQPIQQARVSRAMIVMSISTALAMVIGILGGWILGVLFFIVSLLLIAEVVRSFITLD